MKIIVTGSLGNISKPLTKELVQKGHAVTVISSKPERQAAIEALGATAAIGTLDDVNFITTTFTGADVVYCMLPPFNYFDPNLDVMAAARKLAVNYAQAIRQSGVKRVVHLSSVGAHLEKGNGLLAFHHLAESIVKELPSDVAIIHMRPVGFYTNLYDFKGMIKGQGFLGRFLTLRYSGFIDMIKGKTGIIAANYGAEDKIPWVSPTDIAAAIAEEIIIPFTGRKVRYVASEELTCNQIAKILGSAIGKPYLKWALMSDKQMLSGLKMFGIPQARAEGVVEMNAAIHSGLVDEDYYRNRPAVMGKVKMTDFAKEFAAAFKEN
jgi:uncharacterized protein YbjT (DUF2867 family)